jgi:NAD(P)-dependent dehydrogenase (short-subunit alcohol dehydrogenase family)
MSKSSPHEKPVVLITGAGTGIGRETAIAFAGRGYRIAVTGRRRQPLDETVKLCGLPDDDALAVAADISDPASVAKLFAGVVEKFGHLDVLFNNAGANSRGVLLEDVSFDDWRSVVDTNLTGTFLCIQAAFRVMKSQQPQGGRIINNGSISAHSPRPDSAPYTATKHAITGLTRSASLDGRKYGIACGQIDIGNAVTGLSEHLGRLTKQADGSMKAEPMMNARVVAEAVVHMASLPMEANIQFMTVMATTMPFIGRG